MTTAKQTQLCAHVILHLSIMQGTHVCKRRLAEHFKPCHGAVTSHNSSSIRHHGLAPRLNETRHTDAEPRDALCEVKQLVHDVRR